MGHSIEKNDGILLSLVIRADAGLLVVVLAMTGRWWGEPESEWGAPFMTQPTPKW